jgi:pimeloyl-ACP methyl ester carboxylesterase
MQEDRRHRARSADGTEIVGVVCGTGPPLVLVHGSLADGELEWTDALPHLADRYTCHMMNTRGRGGSGDHPDRSSPRLVEDIIAYVESVGGSPALIGHSFGARLALGAASRGAPVRAVAAFEPPVYDAMDDALWSEWRACFERIRGLHASGRSEEAVRTFVGFVANAEEQAALADATDIMAAMVGYLPLDIAEFEAVSLAPAENPTDAAALARIGVPVLVICGDRSAQAWFAAGARHVARHVSDCRVRTISDVGHLGPLSAPGPVAGIVADFIGPPQAA